MDENGLAGSAFFTKYWPNKSPFSVLLALPSYLGRFHREAPARSNDAAAAAEVWMLAHEQVSRVDRPPSTPWWRRHWV
jgi:hypothetical protein